MKKTDIHQHLWTEPLLQALAQRHELPFVRREHGLTVLYLAGERPYVIDLASEAPAQRAELVRRDGLDRALVCLSSPLGIESLPRAQALGLLDAYHGGALAILTASVTRSSSTTPPPTARSRSARSRTRSAARASCSTGPIAPSSSRRRCSSRERSTGSCSPMPPRAPSAARRRWPPPCKTPQTSRSRGRRLSDETPPRLRTPPARPGPDRP